MTGYQTLATPPVGPAGPVARPPGAPAGERPVWPTVIGIISIVFAGLGVLSALCEAPAAIIARDFARQIAARGRHMPASARGSVVDEFFDMAVPLYTVQLIIPPISLAAAIILLAGGIKLLRRRSSAWRLHMVYVAVKVVSVSMTIAVMSYMMSLMASAFPSAPMGDAEKVIIACAFILAILFGVGYPVFVLIWFLRAKVRREVRAWGAAGQPAVAAP